MTAEKIIKPANGYLMLIIVLTLLIGSIVLGINQEEPLYIIDGKVVDSKTFKALDNDFISKLKETLPDSDVVLRQDNNPFGGGSLIGISYEKGGNLFEWYQWKNDGNAVSYKFVGTGRG